jgi:membrane-associated phosphatidylinositol transfer protein
MTLFNDGFCYDPIKQKAEMLRTAVENAELVIVAAYGSSKDVPAYQMLHVSPERTFLVGKVKQRLHGHAKFIIDGYAVHLGKTSGCSLNR